MFSLSTLTPQGRNADGHAVVQSGGPRSRLTRHARGPVAGSEGITGVGVYAPRGFCYSIKGPEP